MRDKDRLIRAFGKLNMRVTDGVENHMSAWFGMENPFQADMLWFYSVGVILV